ncbi:MAG: mechanosensitive ion channel domain-containing protein [Bdellovibrionales bacterium]
MKMLSRFFLIALIALTPLLAQAMPYREPPIPVRKGITPIAAEIGQQLQALVTGDPNAVDIEPEETFGTRALGLVLNAFKLVGSEGATFFDNFAALPQLATWLAQQANDPILQARWIDTGALLLLVIGASFAAGWLADLVFLALRHKIYHATFKSPWRRFGAIMGWLGISLIPVVLFIAVAVFLIDAQDPTKLARYIVMTVVYALALLRLVRVLLRFFLAPHAISLRFLPITTEVALTVQSWITWLASVMVTGFFTAEIAKTVKVPMAAISGFTNLVALIVVAMTVAVIVRKRVAISAFIRGDLTATGARHSLTGGIRLWLARTWHVLAIFYLIVGYIVTMLGAGGGFTLLQKGTIGTLLFLLAMRFAFYWIAKLKYRKANSSINAGLYRPVMGVLLKIVTWALGMAGIAASWGVDVPALVASPWGQRVLGSVFSITSMLLIVVLVYELLHAAIERKLNKRDAHGRAVQANARARTILPMVKIAAVMVLAVIVGLVTLSELGINIAPLLAGAGILGVAIGFGSQTLVKDFLTGLSIILEDNLAVGDWVTIGGNRGVVENLSIRTVRLRDINGSLHIMPFSAISVITNESKIFSYAMMDVGVSYDSDLDRVMEVIRKTGDVLQVDPAFQSIILESIEVLGVEALGDSSIVIRSRIKTKAGKHAVVRRAFLLAIKKAFDAEKIEIPFPTVKHVNAD